MAKPLVEFEYNNETQKVMLNGKFLIQDDTLSAEDVLLALCFAGIIDYSSCYTED